jgi:hypothetical protein
MDEKTRGEIKALERAIRQKHPHWPEEKTRWLAMQAVGVIPTRR